MAPYTAYEGFKGLYIEVGVKLEYQLAKYFKADLDVDSLSFIYSSYDFCNGCYLFFAPLTHGQTNEQRKGCAPRWLSLG